MTDLDEIIEAIKTEICSCTTSYEYDKGYEICKNYLEKNRINTKSDVISIDIIECLKCLLYIGSNKKMPFDKCESLAKSLTSIFEKYGIDYLTSIVNAMLDVGDLERETYKETIEYFQLPHLDFFKSYQVAYNKMKFEHPNGGANEEKYYEFRDSIRTVKDLIKGDKNIIEFIYYIRENFEVSRRILELLLYRAIQNKGGKYIIESFSLAQAKRAQDSINQFVIGEENKKAEKLKENRRLTIMYNKAIGLLERASKEKEIKNIDEILRCVQNEEIRIKIILWVNEHNQIYYRELQDKVDELRSNDTNRCIAILSKYNISISMEDLKSIMHNSPEEIEEIIKNLPIRELSNESIISILKTTTKEIALKVKELMEKRYITPKKISEYISIYSPKDNKIEIIESYVELLNTLGINPIIFCDQPEFYWTSNGLFKKNIYLLVTYKLANSLKSDINIGFLLEEKLEEKIDMLIELGFYNYLKENIELLNYPLSRIKRIIVLQQMNLPIDNSDILNEILENSKFIVSDRELDDCIMDYASYLEEIPKLPYNPINLETENISVTIGDNIISVPKIKRQLKKGKTIWESIFYGTKLTEEKYNQLMRFLNPEGFYTYK